MDLKGFVYALAMRSDADEQRQLGADFMAAAREHGDPELIMGWLLTDWMELMRETNNNLDSTENDLLDSRTPGRWRALQ